MSVIHAAKKKGQGRFASASVTTYASEDFNTGAVVGASFVDWAATTGDSDFPDDPTGSGRGKVYRLHFAKTGSYGSAQSCDRYLEYSGHVVEAGQTMWFNGDFYVPSDAGSSAFYARKLLYFWPDESRDAAVHHGTSWIIIGGFGNGLQIDCGFTRASDGQRMLNYEGMVPQGPDPSVPTIGSYSFGAWHRVNVGLTLNSGLTTNDGVIEVWLDGTRLFNCTTARFSDAWSGATIADLAYKWFHVGEQMQRNESPWTFDEYRYWDNISFTSGRVP